MGWAFYHRDKGESNADHFAATFPAGHRLVACGTVDHVFYAAVRDPDGTVRAFIALTCWRAHDHLNFGYKELSETCAAHEDAKAPEKVLNALTPTTNPSALGWRDACRHYHNQRKAVRGLRDGDQIVLTRPHRFANGAAHDTFTVRRVPVRGTGTRVILAGPRPDGNTPCTYRLPAWQDSVVAIIRDGEHLPTPLAQRRDESAYARRVERVYRFGAVDEVATALAERYGAQTTGGGLSYLARVEFREGRLWDWLPEAERLRGTEPAPLTASTMPTHPNDPGLREHLQHGDAGDRDR